MKALVNSESRTVECPQYACFVKVLLKGTQSTIQGRNAICGQAPTKIVSITDPEDHIFMHYPDEPEWQLLDQVQTPDQFVDFPVVKSYLFQYGLKAPPKLRSITGNE